MTNHDAARILGVPHDAVPTTIRARYLERLLVVHPDHNRAPDATARTIELTLAYELLISRAPAVPGAPTADVPADPSGVRARPGDALADLGVEVALVDDDTIAVRAPGGETVLRMIEAAGDLGEITFCDPTLGMVQVVIEFVDAPTAQILMTTQGRGDGTTDVFCSVDPFNGGDVPATRPVVEIIAEAIATA